MRISFTESRPWPKGRAVLIGFLSAVLLAGTMIAAAPADAQTDTALEHVCTSLVDYDNIQTVICTDLYEVNYGDGYYDAYTVTEAICQNTLTGSYLTCNYVYMGNETAKATSGVTVLSPYVYGCGGDQFPDCATKARNYFGGTLLTTAATCLANVWGVTLAVPLPGQSTEVQVGDLTGTLVSNLGTPHVNIGNC